MGEAIINAEYLDKAHVKLKATATMYRDKVGHILIRLPFKLG